MSGNRKNAAETLYMRDEIHPSLPAALEQAAERSIAAGPAALRGIREAALSALRRIGLPGAKSEDFTFVRVGEFLPHLSALPEAGPRGGDSAAAFPVPRTAAMPSLDLIKALVFPESRDSHVVLLDGEYLPGLSRPGPFRVGALEAAELSPALASSLTASLDRETDAAASLAALSAPRPLLIRIDAEAAPASPLQVLHLRTPSRVPRRDAFLVVAAGRLSESRILVRHAELAGPGPGHDAGASGAGLPAAGGRQAGSMSNILSLLVLEDGSSVKWLEAAPEGPGNEADIHFHKLNAVLERDSRFFAAQASTGARLARNAFSVDLRGQGAEAEINGAAVLAGSRQAHHFVQVRHLVPHCSSRQHFKTVAADKGRASVDGTIMVSEGAQLTSANQLINNLMLSDEARADSKPRLLIHADDVKCTHGATAGKLDPAQQFYLESRGLPPAQARTLMTLAFIAEIVEKADRAVGIPGSGFRAHLDATLLDTLKRRLAQAPAGGGETPRPRAGAEGA